MTDDIIKWIKMLKDGYHKHRIREKISSGNSKANSKLNGFFSKAIAWTKKEMRK